MNLKIMNLKRSGSILLFLFCTFVLFLSIRGLPGSPTDVQLNDSSWKEAGPFELSPERGRYALLYSMVENRTPIFTTALGRFSTPDVGVQNGKFVSLFAPGVSFIAIPGYIVGKSLGYAQVGSYATIILFAILNIYLIQLIARRLGADSVASAIASLVFLFASPAFSYAVTLSQHHISTFLILINIYLLLRYNNALSLAIIWMFCAFSVTVDYPNLFMMLPIGVCALLKTIIIKRDEKIISIRVPFMRILAFTTALIPICLFMMFNQVSYGHPLQLSATLERALKVDDSGKPMLEGDALREQIKKNKNTEIPSASYFSAFKNRDLMKGFYIHFFSPDRGMIYFTPIMIFGIWGVILALKENEHNLTLLIGVIGFNILLYSMWDDPYGGWAFGSRYLIPSYALLSIFIAFVLTRYKKSIWFLLIFFVIFCYSTGVNTLGALTSNANPPKVEAQSLQKATHRIEKYTYARNIDLINSNESKSFIYQSFIRNHISARDYYIDTTVLIILVIGFLLVEYKILEGGNERTKTYAI